MQVQPEEWSFVMLYLTHMQDQVAISEVNKLYKINRKKELKLAEHRNQATKYIFQLKKQILDNIKVHNILVTCSDIDDFRNYNTQYFCPHLSGNSLQNLVNCEAFKDLWLMFY